MINFKTFYEDSHETDLVNLGKFINRKYIVSIRPANKYAIQNKLGVDHWCKVKIVNHIELLSYKQNPKLLDTPEEQFELFAEVKLPSDPEYQSMHIALAELIKWTYWYSPSWARINVNDVVYDKLENNLEADIVLRRANDELYISLIK